MLNHETQVSEEDFINLYFVIFVLGILKGFPDPHKNKSRVHQQLQFRSVSVTETNPRSFYEQGVIARW